MLEQLSPVNTYELPLSGRNWPYRQRHTYVSLLAKSSQLVFEYLLGITILVYCFMCVTQSRSPHPRQPSLNSDWVDMPFCITLLGARALVGGADGAAAVAVAGGALYTRAAV
jgi:hypothetical protein